MIDVVIMSRETIMFFAEQMIPEMDRALDRRSDATPEGIIKDALTGSIVIWGAFRDEKLIGHVTARPRDQELIIITLAGKDAKEWMPLVQEQLQGLLDKGHYSKIVTGARLGMEKWLKQLGWKTFRVIMEFG